MYLFMSSERYFFFVLFFRGGKLEQAKANHNLRVTRKCCNVFDITDSFPTLGTPASATRLSSLAAAS